MAMGRRKPERQEPLFVTGDNVPRSQGHPFYKALNRLLAEANFDRWIEDRCLPFYDQDESRGQRSIPPGVYFRMLLVGSFEGIDSQRGNRERMQRDKGKQLQRQRSELCERSFAHVCQSGGMRRTWLKGVVETTKRYLLAAAAHHLGRVLLKLFGVGKPRGLQGSGRLVLAFSSTLAVVLRHHHR